jgi:PAS domain S-box-containing protein
VGADYWNVDYTSLNYYNRVDENMTGKIVFIAPDENLANRAKRIISELGEQIEVYQGSLSEGLKLAKKAVDNGANIVISRGGTGNLIKHSLQIPVINIETSGFDVINSIYKAVNYSNNIGIIGFQDLISSYDRIDKIIQNSFSAQITTAVIRNEREAEIKIKQLYKLGVGVFIGGYVAINAVQKFGYNGILIESGNDSIIKAVRNAKSLLEVQLMEKEKSETLKSIIDFVDDGILGVDKDGIITVFNPAAEKIMGIKPELAIGKPITDISKNIRLDNVLKTGNAELDEIQHIGKISIVTNKIPILVEGEVLGVVVTFQELDKIQKMESKIRKKLLYKGHVAKIKFEDIIGHSKAILQTKEKTKQYAEVDSTVLILGETGTGKELFAQSIHNSSSRYNKPFVAVNCAALPENLLESELFGYVEGAFTGARKGGKMGLFELAHKGTIFLDEISEMSPTLQARFLRVLQEKEVVRLGDDRVIPIDIRIIAATNRDLYSRVEKGQFREDLYYRLCVLKLEIPPLRRRSDDIPVLVSFFIKEKSIRLRKRIKGISHKALNELIDYHWPGNVRQLENIIERAVVLCKGQEIDVDIIFEVMNGSPNFIAKEKQSADTEVMANEGLLKNVEYEMIKKVLEETKGNKALAAERLGISVTTLWRRLKKIQS